MSKSVKDAVDDLIVWLRTQLDEDERNLRDGLNEYLDTRFLENDFRFRLAEVDAMRRILDYLDLIGVAALHAFADPAPTAVSPSVYVLRLLALPYADRPGYRQEWRP